VDQTDLHDAIDAKNEAIERLNGEIARLKAEVKRLQPLEFLGTNRAAVMAAMRSYWGDEEITPAWRHLTEVTSFSYALHDAVKAVLHSDNTVHSATQSN